MNTHPQIAQRAYELWEQAGRPHGQDKHHWLLAEAELQAQSAPVPTAKADRAQPMLKTRRAVAANAGQASAKRAGALGR